MTDPERAIAQCDRIISAGEALPERSEAFADPITEKTESIKEWIEEHDQVTEKQQTALDNMEAGVERWQR